MGKEVEWFDGNWMKVRDLEKENGWASLNRRDQVLLAVGFLIDSCIGDGEWAIVDGVIEGQDEGLTVKMPDALEQIGLSKIAEYVNNIILLRKPAGSKVNDEANRERAVAQWEKVLAAFGEFVPGGERVILTTLYQWYHSPEATR